MRIPRIQTVILIFSKAVCDLLLQYFCNCDQAKGIELLCFGSCVCLSCVIDSLGIVVNSTSFSHKPFAVYGTFLHGSVVLGAHMFGYSRP